MDYIDSIAGFQDGKRQRFPIYYVGELEFELDTNSPLSAAIDLDAVLVIFVNGVLQTPGKAIPSLEVLLSSSLNHHNLKIRLISSSILDKMVLMLLRLKLKKQSRKVMMSL